MRGVAVFLFDSPSTNVHISVGGGQRWKLKLAGGGGRPRDATFPGFGSCDDVWQTAEVEHWADGSRGEPQAIGCRI